MGKKAFCYFVICLAFLSFLVKTYTYIYIYYTTFKHGTCWSSSRAVAELIDISFFSTILTLRSLLTICGSKNCYWVLTDY